MSATARATTKPIHRVPTVTVIARDVVVRVKEYGSSKLHCDAKREISGLSQSFAQSLSPHDWAHSKISELLATKNAVMHSLQSTLAKAPFSIESANAIAQTLGMASEPKEHLCNSGNIKEAPEKVDVNSIPGFDKVMLPSKSHPLHTDPLTVATKPVANNPIARNIFFCNVHRISRSIETKQKFQDCLLLS